MLDTTLVLCSVHASCSPSCPTLQQPGHGADSAPGHSCAAGV